MKKSLLLSVLLFNCFSCHKASEVDDVVPEIVIMSPESGKTFINGQPVALRATVKDNSLHEITAKIVSDGTLGEVVFEKTFDAHDKTDYSVSDTWTPSGVKSPTDFVFKIKAEDHGGHLVEASVTFTVNP